MQDNKSIVFLTISFVCIWLTLDSIYGKHYLHYFLANLFSFYSYKVTDSKNTVSTLDYEKAKEMYGEDAIAINIREYKGVPPLINYFA